MRSGSVGSSNSRPQQRESGSPAPGKTKCKTKHLTNLLNVWSGVTFTLCRVQSQNETKRCLAAGTWCNKDSDYKHWTLILHYNTSSDCVGWNVLNVFTHSFIGIFCFCLMFRSDYNQMIHLIINRKLINNYFYNKSSVKHLLVLEFHM